MRSVLMGHSPSTWFGSDDIDEMFDFIGLNQSRCLDQEWYFRIFETGIMLGYPYAGS